MIRSTATGRGRFCHGDYGDYCYLPLYCFCGDVPLWAQLRTADRDGADGTLDALEKIAAAIRERFGRHTRIIVRGGSGFCRDALMVWIEAQENAHCVLGRARNSRLEAMLAPTFWDTAAMIEEELVPCARAAGARTPPKVEGTARKFAELRCQTRESWSCERLPARPPASLFPSSSSVIGKAGITNGENNPRYIVTDIPAEAPVDQSPRHPRRRTRPLRRLLLRPGRHGEPDQRTTARHVRRAHLHRMHEQPFGPELMAEGQPTPAVVLHICLFCS